MQPIIACVLILASLLCMLAHKPALKSAVVLFLSACFLIYRS